jgi:hypothetical protein
MTKDEALKLALEALEANHFLIHGSETKGGLAFCMDGYYSGCFDIDSNDKQTNKAITAIKEALAQPEQEPVAFEKTVCPFCTSEWVTAEQHDRNVDRVEQEPVIDGNTSDGYHTFNELYEFRKAYNIALFNEWAANGKCFVHKSWRHNDGELCFGGGWFIVVAVLPQGQISNHYEAKDWDLFHIQETEKALFEFDGHTGADVIERLKSYTTPPQRTWVGLTDGDIQTEWMLTPQNDKAEGIWFGRRIEAKLKEKNT